MRDAGTDGRGEDVGARLPRLLPGRLVRVWVVDLEDDGWDVDAAAAVLSAVERERAERGTPAVRRRRVLLRAALRRVLGDLLGRSPAAVPIDAVDGRPVVGGSRRHRRVQVSCSASGRVGVVAVAVGTPIGVDVQQLGAEDVGSAVAEGWLSPDEERTIARLPDGEQARALTRAWVQKEAVLKARGIGLRADPSAVRTPVADRGRVGRWSLAVVEVPEGHVAAVAVRARWPRRPPRLHVQRMNA